MAKNPSTATFKNADVFINFATETKAGTRSLKGLALHLDSDNANERALCKAIIDGKITPETLTVSVSNFHIAGETVNEEDLY